VTRPIRDRRGFTSIEVLVATLILSVGLAAVATGLQHASSGIETGRGETTAAFLAEQRLEQLKNLALVDWPSTALSAGTTTETYGAIPSASVYRRVTTITDSPGGTCTANCKLVRITVFYRPVTGQGQLDQERRLDVVTMFVSRI
jgi:prepilin-type N-terminal cleavage/methylation domain-containing protein